MSGLPGFVNPITNPQAWDKFTIAGVPSPGTIRPGGIQGFDRTNEWDIKKGKGTLGGTITFVQQPPAQGKITLTLGYLALAGPTPQQQFDALATFIPLLQYDPTKRLIPPSAAATSALTAANQRARAAQQVLDDFTFKLQQNPPRTPLAIAEAQRALEDARIAAAVAARAAGLASGAAVSTPAPIKAIDIYHPSLASVQVTSVVTEDISPLRYEGKGVWTITFSFIEYKPPPKASAVSTPNFSKGGAAGGGQTGANAIPDPVGDRNDAIIADLLKKASEP